MSLKAPVNVCKASFQTNTIDSLVMSGAYPSLNGAEGQSWGSAEVQLPPQYQWGKSSQQMPGSKGSTAELLEEVAPETDFSLNHWQAVRV